MFGTIGSALLVLTLAATASADTPAPGPGLDVPFSRSTLSLSVAGTADHARDSGVGTATGSVSLRGSTTLAGNVHLAREGESAWAILGGAEARAFSTDLAGIEGAARFYRLGLSVGGFYRAPDRNTYTLLVGAFVAEQEQLLGSATLHPHVAAVGTYRTSDTVTLRYGLAYTYAYGRGIPLPILGLEWRWAPTWRLELLLPVVARVTWAVRPDLTLSGGLGAAGELYRYRAAVDDSLRDLRFVRVRLGVAARWRFAGPWHVGAGVGVEGAAIEDGFTSDRAYGGYGQVTLGYGSTSVAAGALAFQ